MNLQRIIHLIHHKERLFFPGGPSQNFLSLSSSPSQQQSVVVTIKQTFFFFVPTFTYLREEDFICQQKSEFMFAGNTLRNLVRLLLELELSRLSLFRSNFSRFGTIHLEQYSGVPLGFRSARFSRSKVSLSFFSCHIFFSKGLHLGSLASFIIEARLPSK